MKIIFKPYTLTIYGLLLINLMNWLDGVLTYIALFILPDDLFYETNNFAYNQFITIGFFHSFIFKLFLVASISLFLFLVINLSAKGDLFYQVRYLSQPIKRINLMNLKQNLIVNNILIIIFFLCFISIFLVVFQNALGLIIFYYF